MKTDRPINVEIKPCPHGNFPFLSVVTHATTGEHITLFGSDTVHQVLDHIEWWMCETPNPSVIKKITTNIVVAEWIGDELAEMTTGEIRKWRGL